LFVGFTVYRGWEELMCVLEKGGWGGGVEGEEGVDGGGEKRGGEGVSIDLINYLTTGTGIDNK